MNYSKILFYAFSGIFPIVSVTVLGIVLAYKKIFSVKVNAGISKVYSNFFLPLFCFFSIIKSFNLSDFQDIWPLIVSPFSCLILGLLVWKTFSLLFKNTENQGLIKSILVFTNSGNLLVILLKGICSSYGPLSSVSYCADSNSYVALQLLMTVPIIWSYGTSLISSEAEYAEPLANDLIRVNKIPTWKAVLKNLFLPAPIGCFLGLIVSLIPGKSYLFNENSPLHLISEVSIQMSISAIVLAQSSLGSNLVLLGNQSLQLKNSEVFWIVFFKTVCMPALAVPLIYLAWRLNIFGDNIVMAYVVFINYSSPSAFTVLYICQNQNYGVKEVTHMLLGIYCFALPSLLIFTYIFFLVIYT